MRKFRFIKVTAWLLAMAAIPTTGFAADVIRFHGVDEIKGADRRELAATSHTLFHFVRSFVEAPDSLSPFDFHVYRSIEAKGLATGNTDVAHFDPSNRSVHAVHTHWISGVGGHTEVQFVLREWVGEPSFPFLEAGLSVYLADHWRGQDYKAWVRRLWQTGDAPTLGELLKTDDHKYESYLLIEMFSASFVEWIVETFGKQTLLGQYRTWEPDEAEVERLNRSWQEAMAARYATDDVEVAQRKPERGFHKGFCHAHEGYNIMDGYGSQRSDEALQKLSDLGVNSVSITPFTWMRHPRLPARFRFSHFPNGENDETVIHSANTARELGMRVMLKPHIWIRGSWPGGIEMASAESWDRFFANYYRWMRHYAILAEMYQFDILCVGVEMGKTSVGHEDRWREMVRNWREIYRGPVTYAANWGEEFEKVRFWDVFDFIGINCYYPLSDADAASPDELREGFRNALKVMEDVHNRYRRPVLITEIGFTSTIAPWKQPHQDARSADVSMEDQAACYEAVFSELASRRWCRGLYWWKWPSDLRHGGDNHRGFTPNNKAAEGVIKHWYRKTW